MKAKNHFKKNILWSNKYPGFKYFESRKELVPRLF
jgi:hypothetical protein